MVLSPAQQAALDQVRAGSGASSLSPAQQAALDAAAEQRQWAEYDAKQARVKAQGEAEVQAIYDDMPAYQRGLLGANRGIRNMLGSAANLVGLEGEVEVPFAREGEWGTIDSTDKGLRQAREEKRDLGTAGAVGEFIGETAIAAPLGGVAGKGAQLAFKGAQAIPGLTRAAAFASKTAARPTVQAAGQGAVFGSLTADPDERLMGAGLGATLGGGLGLGGQALKKTFGSGLVKIRDEAKELMARGVKDIPLNLAAKEGFAQTVYHHVLRAVPGVGKHLRAQRDDALRGWQNIVNSRALPKEVQSRLDKATDMEHAYRIMDDFFRLEAYEPIKKYALNTASKDLKAAFSGVMGSLKEKSDRKALQGLIDKHLKRTSAVLGPSGKPLSTGGATVDDLLLLRQEASELKIRSPKLSEAIDDFIVKNLAPGKQVLNSKRELLEEFVPTTAAEKELVKYLKLREPYHAKSMISEAMVQESAANYQPRNLEGAIKKYYGTQKNRGQAPLQDLERLGREGLPEHYLNAPHPGFFQKAAVGAPAVAAAGWGTGAKQAAGFAAWPVSWALAQRGTQRSLAGQTKAQQKILANLLKKQNIKDYRTGGRYLRAGAENLVSGANE
tara:strand:- start:15779 stop:17617 length:1839 start_codon:yes stop_codon:yes gene_type:complete